MKKLILFVSFICIALTTNAQTTYEKSKFFDNTYVGLSGTVATPMTDIFPLNAGVSVKLGKWVTPALAFNVEGTMWFGSVSGVNLVSTVKNNRLHFAYDTGVRMSNVELNVQVDMFNLFKYKSDRMFTIIPEVGLGWLHSYNSNANDKSNVSAKTGIEFAFNLGKYKAWQLYIEPEVLWCLTTQHGVQFDKRYGQVGLQIGCNYRFKNSYGGHNFKTYNIEDYDNLIYALNQEIAELNDELTNKPAEIINTVEVPVAVPVARPYDSRIVVYFAKDSDDIIDSTLLDELPEGTTVTVYGYASPEGNDKYNTELSQRRANAVAKHLQDRGVIINTAEGVGVTNNTSNRVVIVFTDGGN